MRNIAMAGLFISVLIGCKKDDEPSFSREIEYNFVDTYNGWYGMFSDYPKGQEEFYELEAKLARLPEPLDTNIMTFKLSGNNHSDDLFTYMYAPVTGLTPNTTYEVSFNVMFASNVSTNSVGAGGSPDLAIGVGGLDTIPVNLLDESNYYRPSFPVELQSDRSNEVMQVIGHMGISDTTTVYTPKSTNNYGNPIKLTTNGYGMLYLLLGWDSGFEGKTTMYIKTIIVRFEYRGK